MLFADNEPISAATVVNDEPFDAVSLDTEELLPAREPTSAATVVSDELVFVGLVADVPSVETAPTSAAIELVPVGATVVCAGGDFAVVSVVIGDADAVVVAKAPPVVPVVAVASADVETELMPAVVSLDAPTPSADMLFVAVLVPAVGAIDAIDTVGVAVVADAAGAVGVN